MRHFYWITDEQVSRAIVTLLDKNGVLQVGTDHAKSIAVNRYQQLLGQEFAAVVLKMSQSINVDIIAALSGCVVEGGSFVVIADRVDLSTPYLARMNRLFEMHKVCVDSARLEQLKEKLTAVNYGLKTGVEIAQALTVEQHAACEQVERVVLGQRKKPLFLSGDRGRGKSTVLAYSYVKLVMKYGKRIAVVAPQKHHLSTFYETLNKLGVSVDVWTLQELLVDKSNIDAVFVDEAAGFNVDLLRQLTLSFNRVVFSTTVQGYEGSGLGFKHKFLKELLRTSRGLRQFELTKPQRWSDSDSLEILMTESLLLKPCVDLDVYANNETTKRVSLEKCTIQKLDRTELSNNEQRLKTCAALLINAHYRTRPSDFQRILDEENTELWAVVEQRTIIALAVLVKEGGLDETIAEGVARGTRRVYGHLAAQNLVQAIGNTQFLSLTSLRVQRIVVEPLLQNNGIGSYLLGYLKNHYKKDYPWLTTSFGISRDLLRFWHKNEFYLQCLGERINPSSGSVSGVSLSVSLKTTGVPDCCSVTTKNLIAYMSLYPEQLGLAASVELSRQLYGCVVSRFDRQQCKRFADNEVSFVHVGSALKNLCLQYYSQQKNIDASLKHNTFRRCVLHQSWSQCVHESNVAGRDQYEKFMRDEVIIMLGSD